MKLNNRGMTLVEMIVAFAILGIVSASIFSMMLTGTKTYTKLTNTVKVQYDAQLASAKIEKNILNCNDAIYWTDNLIVMVQDNTVHAYKLDTTTKTLSYGTETLDGEGKATLTMHMLAEYVESMRIVSPATVSAGEKVKYVQLNMYFKRNDKEYTMDKAVSLRNMPIFKMYDVTIP